MKPIVNQQYLTERHEIPRSLLASSQHRWLMKLLVLFFIVSSLVHHAYGQPTGFTATSNASGTSMSLAWTNAARPYSSALIVYTLNGLFGTFTPSGDYAGTAQNTMIDATNGVYFVYWDGAGFVDHTPTMPNTTYYYRAYSCKSNATYDGLFTSSTDSSLPVELGSWTASSSDGKVDLEWITESEIENQGFIIERASNTPAFAWEEIASFITDPELLGQGSSTERSLYTFTDIHVNVGELYSYRLADVDYNSTITYHDEISVTVRQYNQDLKPSDLVLMDAYPNPFNPSTTLNFQILNDAYVSFKIYDLRGNEIIQLIQRQMEAGWYSVVWEPLESGGKAIPSGIYIARIQAGPNSQTVKMMYLE
ncbi:MAG: T9SS type A sorting domain-containing protein [Candidatus Marinimicrobia bacterium]|nr:T9SS type A sorting domain-containing protein [Candidatus Neomarinimicrobiota bacterium]